MINLDKIEEIIAGIEIGFALTRQASHLHGRPLATLTIDNDGCLWFFVNLHSDIACELQENPCMDITYNDPATGNYLLLSGHGEIVKDNRKKKTLWHPALRPWLHASPEDEDLVLLKMKISTASYWDQKRGTMCEESADVNIIPINAAPGREQLGRSVS